MESNSQRDPSDVRKSMSVPGVVRFVNRTGVVARNIKVNGFWADGSLPLDWNKSDDAAAEQFIRLYGELLAGVEEGWMLAFLCLLTLLVVPPQEHSSVWVKFSLQISETRTIWLQIYADNHTDTDQGKRDVFFSFHRTEGETAQYDDWQSGKKNFTLDMDSSKPNESEWYFGVVHQPQIETDHQRRRS